VLDLSNIFPVIGSPSNKFAELLAENAKTALDNQSGTSFHSIQALVGLEESITHHLAEISLTDEQQEVNCKVLSNEF
jgi:hypothetical protein